MTTTTPCTVLVADDDPDLCAYVCVVLANAGYSAVAVGSGAELLRWAAVRAPRLIVLDLRMPQMGGLDVCRALRADPRTADCAVLLMSSHASEEDIETGYAAGADDYLAKPFRPSQLLDRVTRLLETRRSA